MLFWICVALISTYLLVESRQLKKALAAIAVRVHVYGTRGKSTISRCLVQVLRDGGRRTMGKVTGDAPLILMPDGSETTIRRIGPANIREYINCLRTAASHNCEAVVFECMALSPETIVTAGRILEPTHVIVTNTRPDHHETMGTTPIAIADTLALSVYKAKMVFATQDSGYERVKARVAETGGTLCGIEDVKVRFDLQGKEIVSRVAAEFALPTLSMPEVSWPAFQSCHMDEIGDFLFLDLFSVNDVVSSALLLEKAVQDLRNKNAPALPLVALMATRSDRPLRTKVFIEWFGCEKPFDFHAFVGDHCLYANLAMQRKRMGTLIPVLNPWIAPGRLPMLIWEKVGGPFLLVGLGNVHGYGEVFRQFLTGERTRCS